MLTFEEIRIIARDINAFLETKHILLSGKGRTRGVIEKEVNNFLNTLDTQISTFIESNGIDTDTKALITRFSLFQASQIMEKKLKPAKPQSRVYAGEKVNKKIYISANSPNLLAQFSRIGFVDQNGYSYYGNPAILVLQTLWESKFVPDEIKQTGYTSQATVTIEAVTKEVEIKDGVLSVVNRPVKIAHKRTVIKNNTVLSQGFNGSSVKAIDTKPLFVNGEVALNHIVAVDWHDPKVTKLKKIQNIKTTDLRKKKVKQKISWGTRYLAVNYKGSSRYGFNVVLPDTPSLDKNTKYRLVFEPSGKINLYLHDNNTLSLTLGTYTAKYDSKLGGHILKLDIYQDVYKNFPHWVQPLDKNITDILKSEARSKEQSLEFSIFSRQSQEIEKYYRGRLTPRQLKRLKTTAKKAVFKIYRSASALEILPVDILKACDDLSCKKDISDTLRSYYNNLFIAYYKLYIAGENVQELIKHTSVKNKTIHDFSDMSGFNQKTVSGYIQPKDDKYAQQNNDVIDKFSSSAV